MERVQETFRCETGLEDQLEIPVEHSQTPLSQPSHAVEHQETVSLAKGQLPAIERTNQVLKEIYEKWDDAPYGYQWPASRLSRHEMARLTIVSNSVKRPLNQLIKEAVCFYADKLLIELGFEVPGVLDPESKHG